MKTNLVFFNFSFEIKVQSLNIHNNNFSYVYDLKLRSYGTRMIIIFFTEGISSKRTFGSV